jgi:PTS system nitrogen regulatory IIA component
MDMSDILTPAAVVNRLDAHTKKHALQEISEIAARQTGVAEREIFDTLNQRERLGSTGVGGGIAIPHGKLVGLDELKGFLFRLAQPIDFEALDDQPVDIVFCLLAPEDAGADHLKALAKIARVLRTPGVADAIREAESAADLYAAVTKSPVAAH